MRIETETSEQTAQSMGYLVDTDILIYRLTQKYPQVQQKMGLVAPADLFISAITVAELYFGAYNSTYVQKNLALLEEMLPQLNILPFNSQTGRIFGQIKADLKQRGEIVNDSDLFIGATALSHNLTLVTNNEKHFQRINKLNIENWTQ
jgi:tRNA(fMet)-specific endonuclease VapC